MAISIARLSESGSTTARTVRRAGANEISGDAFIVSVSPAPTDNADVISSNPQRMARPFIDVLPRPDLSASHGPAQFTAGLNKRLLSLDLALGCALPF